MAEVAWETCDGLGRTARKRGLILDAATDLFLREGFLGTSMDEVATRAGVSKQTVYKQFASKEALFLGIVHSMTGNASDRVQTEMAFPANVDQVEQALREHADRLMTIALTPRLLQLRRMIIGEATRFPALGKALYEGGPGRAITGLATMLSRWAAARLLNVDDATGAATQFNWLIMGEPVNRAMFYGDQEQMSRSLRAKYIESGVRVFMAAYGPR